MLKIFLTKKKIGVLVLKTIKLIVFSTCIFTFTSCNFLSKIECTKINGIKVTKLNTEGITAIILLTIKNNNSIELTVFESEFDIVYANINIGKAKLDKNIVIKSNSENEYSLILKSDFKNVNLLDAIKLIGGISEKGMLEVKGDLVVGKYFFKMKFPILVKEKLSLN